MRQGTNTEAIGAMTARFGFALLEAFSDSKFFVHVGLHPGRCDTRLGLWHDGHLQGTMLHRRGIAWAGGVSQLLLFGYSVMVIARGGQGGERLRSMKTARYQKGCGKHGRI
jgi:hypothetical protein